MHSPFFPVPDVAPLGARLIKPLLNPFGRGAGRALAHNNAKRVATTAHGHLSYETGRLVQALHPRDPSKGLASFPLGHDGWRLVVGGDSSGVFVQKAQGGDNDASRWIRVAPFAVTLARTIDVDGAPHPVPWWLFEEGTDSRAHDPRLGAIQAAWHEEAWAWAQACTNAPVLDAERHPLDGLAPDGRAPGWCLPNRWMDPEVERRLGLLMGLLTETAPHLADATPQARIQIACRGGHVDATGRLHGLGISVVGLGGPAGNTLATRITQALSQPDALKTFPLHARVHPHQVVLPTLPHISSAHRLVLRVKDAQAFLDTGALPAYLWA